MVTFLTFVLVAPLGAMGSLAVGERRGGWDRPGRSAILGLIAGSLGIDRSAEADHTVLAAGFGLAIRREGAATPSLSDYHTAQAAPTRRNRVFATRREEVAGGDLQTVLTRRDYRADIAFTLALWPSGESRWTLEEVAAALRHPHFVPFFGRKSCPLGLPMAPLIVTAETVRAAFLARDAAADPLERRFLMQHGEGTLWCETAPGTPPLGLAESYRETRRDEPLSRRRWQFGLRNELVAAWPGAEPSP